MEPGPLKTSEFTAEEKKALLALARKSIETGLDKGKALEPDQKDLSAKLLEDAAVFVTLQKNGQLRGCIGSLEAHRPLAEDVAQNAFAAAFQDPRFQAMQKSELAELEIHISVLTPSVDFPVSSEKDLIEKLRPGIDGLILSDGWHRATFLPSVWESLSRPEDFLCQLKMKAGLDPDHWSDSMRFKRYQVVDIH